MRDLPKLLVPLGKQAIHLVRAETATTAFFGGLPKVGPDFHWPHSNGKPLSFMGQVNLSELGAIRPDWLPDWGWLLFFYDVYEQPWGFDPKHRDGWRVIHIPDDPGLQEPPVPQALGADLQFSRLAMATRSITTLPSWERSCIDELNLSDSESDLLEELSDSVYSNTPYHQIDGYPMPVQGDQMELDCHLASNGVYVGDLSGYDSPVAANLQGGPDEWKLLLQVDTDEALGAMWGDVGTLYYWIREKDARACRFDRAWLVLQCC